MLDKFRKATKAHEDLVKDMENFQKLAKDTKDRER